MTSYESGIDLEHALRANRMDQSHSYQRRAAAYLGLRGQEVSVRRFYSSDLAAVMRLYDLESARGHYLLARDQETWDWQLGFLADIGRYDQDDFLVAEVDDEIVAYLRMVSNGQVTWFLENEAARFSIIEYAGDHPDAAEALLGAAAQSARDYNAERIGLFVHPKSRLMRQCLGAWGNAARVHRGGLPAPARPAPTAEPARPHAGSPPGRVALWRGATTARDDRGSDGRSYAGRRRPALNLELPAADFVRLVTGWFGVDDLAGGTAGREIAIGWMCSFPRGSRAWRSPICCKRIPG
jgi:hypothetical protein